MSQVLQTSGDYKIKSARGGSIVLDTGPNIGEVRVTGDLVVEGETVYIQATNLEVEDNIILLNKGETGNGVTEGYSGIEIDRGFFSPGLENPFPSFRFDELANGWEIVERIGTVISYNNSTLKVRQITTDSTTDGGDLTLIGTGTGVVKVLGTTNYELQVNADDDIPNKLYVDLAIRNRDPDNLIQRGDTFVIVQDTSGGATGRAVMTASIVTINQPGSNYTVGELLVINGGTAGVDAVIEVTAILPGGGIDDFTVVSGGQYIELPISNTNIPTSANSLGIGATFDIVWAVYAVEIINPGDDYESATISFSSGDAAASATVDLNTSSITYRQITATSVTNDGVSLGGPGYLTIPAVTFIAGSSLALTESRVNVVVDGQTTATFYSNRVDIGGLEISENAITNNDTNGNIVLRTFGTAGVEFNRSAFFNSTGTLDPVFAIPGGTLIFSNDLTIDYKNPAGELTENVEVLTPGGTGLYYNNESQTIAWQQWVTNNTQFNSGDLVSYPVKNELISKHKALAYSILF